MKCCRFLTKLLLIIGALNWGLVGFLNYDLIGDVFGGGPGARVIFALIGLAGLYAIMLLCQCCSCGGGCGSGGCSGGCGCGTTGCNCGKKGQGGQY